MSILGDQFQSADWKGEKHVPVMTVVRDCGLMGGGCIDIHTRIGEVLHPMEEKHFIQWVDFYVNRKFVARQYFFQYGKLQNLRVL